MKYIPPQMQISLAANLSGFLQDGFDSLVCIILLNPSQNASQAGYLRQQYVFQVQVTSVLPPKHSELGQSESPCDLGFDPLHKCACKGRSMAGGVTGE